MITTALTVESNVVVPMTVTSTSDSGVGSGVGVGVGSGVDNSESFVDTCSLTVVLRLSAMIMVTVLSSATHLNSSVLMLVPLETFCTMGLTVSVRYR